MEALAEALAQLEVTLHQILWPALAELACCLSSVDQQRITAVAVVVAATEETELAVLAVTVAVELVAISLLHPLAVQQTQAAVVAARAETMWEQHWEVLELSLCPIQAHQEERAEQSRLPAETPSIHSRLVERWSSHEIRSTNHRRYGCPSCRYADSRVGARQPRRRVGGM